MSRHWVRTITGKSFDYTNPQEDMIDLETIATGLAFAVRFNGQTGTCYSVAEHSVLVSRIVPREDRLWGLMHDAHEAYTGDIVTPLKASIPEIRTYEKSIQNAICLHFDMPRDQPLSVYKADSQLLVAEKNYFFGEDDDWGLTEKAALVDIKVWEPRLAKQKFLWEFNKIMWGQD